MIKDNMTRIQITLSKAQAQWLENICEKADISKSKYISWILSKKAEELLKILNLNTHLGNYTLNEIDEIIAPKKWTDEEAINIAKAKWIDD